MLDVERYELCRIENSYLRERLIRRDTLNSMLTEYNGMLERYNKELTVAYREATVDVVDLNRQNIELENYKNILLATNGVTAALVILFVFIK
jgi:hypothetical protein